MSTPLLVHLGRRVVMLTLVIAGVVGGVAWAAVHLDPRVWSQLEPGAGFWFVVGIGLSTAPLSAFLAATWYWLFLRTSGQLSVFEASGHSPARLRLYLALAVALVLAGAALTTEAFLPQARSSAGARLSWELEARHSTVFFSGEERLVVRAGASLDHLTEVWRWREGVPVQSSDVRWDGAGWVCEGAPVLGIPSPLELIAARPSLFELLSVSELVKVGAGVRWKERVLRPLFWWLWIACALAALSAWPTSTLPSVLALGFFLVVGVTLQALSAELAFGAASQGGQWLALGTAPLASAALWVVAARRSAQRQRAS